MSTNRKYKYAALCIGINTYAHNDHLSNAVNDASAMADVFEMLGYDVTRLIDTNATYDGFLDALEVLMSNNFEKKYDAIILYFAGHGFIANNSDCLALQDCAKIVKGDRATLAKAKSIDVQFFIDTFRKRTTPTLIIILDACRRDVSDYADMPERGISTETAELGKYVHVPSQAFIAYSTSADDGTPDGGALGHSKYTAALLEEIIKEVPIEKVFKNVRSRVYLTEEDKLPWEYTCLTSDFYFNYGQLDPYYDAEYSKEAYRYNTYNTKNTDARKIIDGLKSGKEEDINAALVLLLSKKGELGEEDLFVAGRYIYRNASIRSNACQKYMTSKTIKLFGENVNHLLRGVYYEIYFDDNDNLRASVLGKPSVLAIVDNLQRIMKDNEAAKFIRKCVDKRNGSFLFEIWNTTTMLNVEIDAVEMYCTDERDNILYGVRNIVVDGENLLSRLQLDLQKEITKDQLRLQIAETLALPSCRLKIKGLEEDKEEKRRYIMFYIEEIEVDLMNAINNNLPDDIVMMSSNSYVDELYAVVIEEISYDGSILTLEGTCKVEIHNEMDHEEMPGCTLPCEFVAEFSYNSETNSYIVNDGDFTVDTSLYYRQPSLFEE